MFLMVQSLLAERFQLAARFEERELLVFEVSLARPGKLGPNMSPHANGPPCDRPGAPAGPGLSVNWNAHRERLTKAISSSQGLSRHAGLL